MENRDFSDKMINSMLITETAKAIKRKTLKKIMDFKSLTKNNSTYAQRKESFNKIPKAFRTDACAGCGKRYNESDCGCPAGSSERLRSEKEIFQILHKA